MLIGRISKYANLRTCFGGNNQACAALEEATSHIVQFICSGSVHLRSSGQTARGLSYKLLLIVRQGNVAYNGCGERDRPMNTYPRLEARVSAQERRQNMLDARIEELSEDMAANIKELSDDMKASFKQLAGYQIQAEQQLDTRFNRIETRLDRV